jgi:hypothetical protein
MSDGEAKSHSEVSTKTSGAEARENSRAAKSCAEVARDASREAYWPCGSGGSHAYSGLAN